MRTLQSVDLSDTDRAWAYFVRGLVSERMADLAAAERAYEACRALAVAPAAMRAALELSTVARRRTDLDTAQRWLEIAVHEAERLGSEPFTVTARGVMANPGPSAGAVHVVGVPLQGRARHAPGPRERRLRGHLHRDDRHRPVQVRAL